MATKAEISTLYRLAYMGSLLHRRLSDEFVPLDLPDLSFQETREIEDEARIDIERLTGVHAGDISDRLEKVTGLKTQLNEAHIAIRDIEEQYAVPRNERYAKARGAVDDTEQRENDIKALRDDRNAIEAERDALRAECKKLRKQADGYMPDISRIGKRRPKHRPATNTDRQIRKAVDDILARGEKATSRRVRDELGSGSPNRINPVVKEYLDELSQAET